MTSEGTLVERLVADQQAVYDHLISSGEPSFASIVEDIAPKVALLASASSLESLLTETVLSYFSQQLSSQPHACEFIDRKCLRRQYHTLFDWDRNNANKFFAYFGDEFKTLVTAHIARNSDLEGSVRAFMELGRLRNELVHGDYAAFRLNKTTAEILTLYLQARRFMAGLSDLLTGRFMSSG